MPYFGHNEDMHDFCPYGAFPLSDVPEMVDQQNVWNALVISTYLLYLEWNVGMLAVNICILWPPTPTHSDFIVGRATRKPSFCHSLHFLWCMAQRSLHAFTKVNSSSYIFFYHWFPLIGYTQYPQALSQLLRFPLVGYHTISLGPSCTLCPCTHHHTSTTYPRRQLTRASLIS
jgi:hypothetical protein